MVKKNQNKRNVMKAVTKDLSMLKREKKDLQKVKRDWSLLNGNTVNFALRNTKPKFTKREAPIVQGARYQQGQPLVVTAFDRTRVKHTEYVSDITGTSAYTGLQFTVNPGNGELFPWLSTIAQRFQSYLFKSLVFRYEPITPTTTSGTVVLTVDYDSNATLPASKVEALSMESAVRVQPWDCIKHISAQHNLRKRSTYFVRNGTDDVVDSELYDVGSLMVITEGCSVTTSVGELYVDYEVELITPILTNATSSVTGASSVIQATSPPNPTDGRLLYSNSVAITPSDAPFRILPFFQQTDSGFTPAILAQSIGFNQPGVYIMTVKLGSSTITLSAGNHFAWGSSNSGQLVNVLPGPSQGYTLDTSTNVAMATFIVTASSQSATVAFGIGGATGGTGTYNTTIMISPFNAAALGALGLSSLRTRGLIFSGRRKALHAHAKNEPLLSQRLETGCYEEPPTDCYDQVCDCCPLPRNKHGSVELMICNLQARLRGLEVKGYLDRLERKPVSAERIPLVRVNSHEHIGVIGGKA